LATEIKKTVTYARVLTVDAEEINDLMEENRLSVEEILSLKTAHIFKEWPKPMGTLLLDAFNQKPQEWVLPFQKLLATAPGMTNVVCESSMRADIKNVANKAAWVVARVERDRRLHQLAGLHKHDTGSGYLSDFKTREYLRVFVPKLTRESHPVNMIRYHGWTRKMISGWREIEEYRWKRQKEEYYQQYPSMLKGDPLRGTGLFEPKDGPRKSWSQHPLSERAVGVAESDSGVPPK
jgi:ribonuclease HII